MQHPRVKNIDLPIGLLAEGALGMRLLLLVPLAVFAAAVQLWIAFQARTYKEAQTKLSTLIFAADAPGISVRIRIDRTRALDDVHSYDWSTRMLMALVRGEAAAVMNLVAVLSAITLAAAPRHGWQPRTSWGASPCCGEPAGDHAATRPRAATTAASGC